MDSSTQEGSDTMIMSPPATAMARGTSIRWGSLCDLILTAIPANAEKGSLVLQASIFRASQR